MLCANDTKHVSSEAQGGLREVESVKEKVQTQQPACLERSAVQGHCTRKSGLGKSGCGGLKGLEWKGWKGDDMLSAIRWISNDEEI